MQNKDKALLTSMELLCMLTGTLIGAGILSLPNSIVAKAHQDAWISTFIGGTYPLYIVLVGGIIIRRCPNENIIQLYKKYLGNIFGNILNSLFVLQFFTYIIFLINSSINITYANGNSFLEPYKLVFVMVLLILYASSRELKVLSRINVILFFITLILVLSSIMSFQKLNLSNIEPIFGTGFKTILKGSIEAIFPYAGIEILLIIYPIVQNKKNTVKAAILSVIIVIVLYTLIVLNTTLFLGPDIVPKFLWPYLLVYDAFKLQIVSNFKFVFMILWIMVLFKTGSNEYYVIVEILNSITNIKKKKIYLCLVPIIFFIPLYIKNEIMRRTISSIIMPYFMIFNICYVTVMAAIVLVVKRKNKQKLI